MVPIPVCPVVLNSGAELEMNRCGRVAERCRLIGPAASAVAGIEVGQGPAIGEIRMEVDRRQVGAGKGELLLPFCAALPNAEGKEQKVQLVHILSSNIHTSGSDPDPDLTLHHHFRRRPFVDVDETTIRIPAGSVNRVTLFISLDHPAIASVFRFAHSLLSVFLLHTRQLSS